MRDRHIQPYSFMKGSEKLRLDELLVRKGHCSSRNQAKAMIMAGKVRVGTEIFDKPGKTISMDTDIFLQQAMPYVGRGGLKMENFIEDSKIEIPAEPILDLGASTGGFTDYLLQSGASQATCVDVGHGQLHYKLRTDSRVCNLEKTNLRNLEPENIKGSPFSLVVMDLSFISLTKVLHKAWEFVRRGGTLIALVKPQFECLKEEADRGRGVIKDPEIQNRTLSEIIEFSLSHLSSSSLITQQEASPRGTDGNREFFLALRKELED